MANRTQSQIIITMSEVITEMSTNTENEATLVKLNALHFLLVKLAKSLTEGGMQTVQA